MICCVGFQRRGVLPTQVHNDDEESVQRVVQYWLDLLALCDCSSAVEEGKSHGQVVRGLDNITCISAIYESSRHIRSLAHFLSIYSEV